MALFFYCYEIDKKSRAILTLLLINSRLRGAELYYFQGDDIRIILNSSQFISVPPPF